ncbi:MAG: CinA family protein [Clostridia bacterium]|nr:CinA family protein [Clostridia bacterium]
MKISLIAFKQHNACLPEREIGDISAALHGANFTADDVFLLSGEDEEKFKDNFYKIRQAYDAVIVLNCIYNDFVVTEAIPPYEKLNFVYEDECGKLIILEDSEKRVGYLEERLIPRLEEKCGRRFGKVTFKVFGVEKSELKENCDLIAKETRVDFNIAGENLDYKVEIIYDNASTKMEYDAAQKKFLDLFSESVYAEYDVGLSQRLVDILKLRKCVLSTAESFTGGNIAASVVSVSGASEVFYEGIVAYYEKAKMKRLGVPRETLLRYKPVSREVASEMAKGALENADIALSTTGLAGPDSDDSGFPVGLCYIGIAYGDKVKVYKYEFTGNRDEIIKKGTKTAMFLAIKTLKNI